MLPPSLAFIICKTFFVQNDTVFSFRMWRSLWFLCGSIATTDKQHTQEPVVSKWCSPTSYQASEWLLPKGSTPHSHPLTHPWTAHKLVDYISHLHSCYIRNSTTHHGLFHSSDSAVVYLKRTQGSPWLHYLFHQFETFVCASAALPTARFCKLDMTNYFCHALIFWPAINDLL